MNRGERREKSKRKWISRARKVYNTLGPFYVPKEGIKKYCCRFTFENIKSCESITDFLNSSKYAKLLKKNTTVYKDTREQIEAKAKNKRDRKLSKQKAKKEAEEFGKWEYTCESCIHFNYGTCDKNYENLKGEECPDFWD